MGFRLPLLVCIFFLFVFQIQAQGVRYPDHSILYESNNNYFNNSILTKNHTFKIGNQGNLGAYSEISFFYGIGSLVLGKEKDHGLSFGVYSLKEGPLISENRLKAGFWKKFNFSNYNITFGGQIGGINTSFGATRSTPSANSWNVDLDFGTTIQSKLHSFSMSFNQMTETQASPLSQTTQFKRFWTILYYYNWIFSPRITLRPVAYSYYIFGKEHLLNVKLLLSYFDRFTFGAGYGSEGLLFNIELNQLSISKHLFELKSAFRIPSVGVNTPISQAFIIEIAYYFDRSE